MTYQETLDYMFSSLPMYHRIGKAAYKADITNTVQLMQHLGHPETQFRSIHVAGTNGKGSVSHMLASILQQAGYKVGLYTSPHLVDFRERIRIGGQMIPQDEVTRFVEQNKDFFQSLELSFFEMTVGLAFDYFAREQVDIAVIEVGMGGRLDSTNVITPLLSIITNIGFDHTQFLGNTLPLIAGEKAGIIKPRVPVVIGETQPETQPVFDQKAAEQDSPICYADQHYTIQSIGNAVLGIDFDVMRDGEVLYKGLHCPLGGAYQLKNLATVMQAAELLAQQGLRIGTEQIRQGIAQVVQDTGFHGRWEVLGQHPLTVCETAHNADGVHSMLQKLQSIPYRRLHLIYGCVNDKDYRTILRMLPQDATYYYTQPSVPRGLPVDQLATAAAECGMPGKAFSHVHQAMDYATSQADPDDMILVTGSIFLIADALSPREN